MSNTVYANVDAHLVCTGGGHLTGAIGAASTTQIVTSVHPCKIAYINALCNNAVNCTINSSTAVSTAVMVPTISVASVGSIGTLELAIDDLSKLWFYASAAASVNVTYVH